MFTLKAISLVRGRHINTEENTTQPVSQRKLAVPEYVSFRVPLFSWRLLNTPKYFYEANISMFIILYSVRGS